MMLKAVMLMSCVVLFNHTGLCEAVEKVTHYRFRIMGCCKCGTFWVVLTYLLLTTRDAIVSVTAAFILSYAAIWFELLLGIIATRYNELSEIYTTEIGGETGAETGQDETASTSVPEV